MAAPCVSSSGIGDDPVEAATRWRMHLSEEMREPFLAGEMIVIIWLGGCGASQGRTKTETTWLEVRSFLRLSGPGGDCVGHRDIGTLAGSEAVALAGALHLKASARQKPHRRPSDPQQTARQGDQHAGAHLRAGGVPDWLLPIGVLAALCAMAFSRTATYTVIGWDDPVNVTDNPYVMQPSLRGILELWTRPYCSLYAPLVYTSYISDLLIGFGAFQALHVSNIVIHAAGAWCVYFLALRLGVGRFAAFAGAGVFAVHPLQAEAVSWVTGRRDILAGVLCIAAVLQFDRWLDRPTALRYATGIILFFLALASKPSAVVAPLMAMLLLDLRGLLRSRTALWLIPWFALAGIWMLIAAGAQSEVEAAPFWVAWWKRPFVAADSVFFYVQKILAPWGLGPIYPRTNRTIFTSWVIWLKLPVLVIAVVLLVQRKLPRIVAGLFVLALLPVLGLTPFYYQYHANVADRYCYIAMAGTGCAVAWILHSVLERLSSQRVVISSAAAVVLAVLAVLTFNQTRYWKTSQSLWERELVIDPKSTAAWYNLGMEHVEHQQPDKALTCFARSVEIDPQFARGYINLLLLNRRLGHRDKSDEVARSALQLRGESEDACLALGHAYTQLGRLEKAEQAFREAVRQAPDDADAYNSLGFTLMDLKRPKEAQVEFSRAVEVNPMQASSYANLGLALAATGKAHAGRRAIERAMEIDPNDPRFPEYLRRIEHKQQSR